MEIKVKIDAPGLEKAITLLAEAISTPSIKLDSKGLVATGVNNTSTDTAIKKDKPKQEAPKEDPKETPEEGKEESNTISLETVRVKLAELAQNGKQKEVKALITSLGAAKLSDVPEEQYAELLEKASEI